MNWFRQPETVVCHECRHVVERASAQKIEYYPRGCEEYDRFYCREHHKPYDRYGENRNEFREVYYRLMRVDDHDGCPFGYMPNGHTSHK